MPGKSGNPGGRPRRKWMTDLAEELLEERLENSPEYRQQYKEMLWANMLSNKVVGAMTRDSVWERTEGKVSQPVDLNGNISVLTISERMQKARKRKKHNI